MLGVRGSTAAPGAGLRPPRRAHVVPRVTPEKWIARPWSSTRARASAPLTGLLRGAPFHGSIVLSHLHWDHVQGLPFFAAGDRADARVDLYVPAQDGRSGRDLLAQSLSPPAFPITPEGLRGAWTFHAMARGGTRSRASTVTAVEIEHKGGRTFGLRVDDERGSLAYLPDHAPAAGISRELGRCWRGRRARPRRPVPGRASGRSPSTTGMPRCRTRSRWPVLPAPGTLVLFHHSPARSDDALDEIASWARDLAGDLPVVVAREGMALDVIPRDPDSCLIRALPPPSVGTRVQQPARYPRQPGPAPPGRRRTGRAGPGPRSSPPAPSGRAGGTPAVRPPAWAASPPRRPGPGPPRRRHHCRSSWSAAASRPSAGTRRRPVRARFPPPPAPPIEMFTATTGPSSRSVRRSTGRLSRTPPSMSSRPSSSAIGANSTGSRPTR